MARENIQPLPLGASGRTCGEPRSNPELPPDTQSLLDECRRLALELIGNDSERAVNVMLLAYVSVLRRSIVAGMQQRDPVSDTELAAELRRFAPAREP